MSNENQTPQPPQAGASERDQEILQLIDERDSFEHMGTVLAEKVSELLDVEVGEWSSANNPIFRAIHAIEDRLGAVAPAAPAVAPTYVEIDALIRDYGKACHESSSATRMNEAHDAIMIAFWRALAAPAPTEDDHIECGACAVPAPEQEEVRDEQQAARGVVPNEFQKDAIRWLQGELSKCDFPPSGIRDQWRNSVQSLCVDLLDASAPPRDALVSAMQQLTKALRKDHGYAWAWHCNLAMPIMDATGVSHDQANEAGARLMQHLFDIDVRKFPEWEEIGARIAVPLEERDDCPFCDGKVGIGGARGDCPAWNHYSKPRLDKGSDK